MSNDSQQGDWLPGSNVRVRQTPEHARKARRQAFQAGLFGILLGLVALGSGVWGIYTGEWVGFGRQYSSVEVPGWVAVVMGLFILYLSGWFILKAARKGE